MVNRILFVIAIWVIIDLYVFQALKTIAAGWSPAWRNGIYLCYWLIDALIITSFLFVIFSGKMAHGPPKGGSWLMGLMILSLVPKLCVVPFLLLEDVVRIVSGTVTKISSLFSHAPDEASAFFSSRRKFVSQAALIVSAIPFTGILYGVFRGKYNYRVHRVTLYLKGLPEAFRGFTITQLSDIHAGSLDNREEVERGIALANAQQSDLMVFTGDLVNNRAEEMEEWIEVFAALKAPFGKYSILGNHDYGDYSKWTDEAAKANNLNEVKHIHERIGFRLLQNESLTIEKEGQKLRLAGVENWGTRGFAQYGDLHKAMAQVEPDSFTILLSHDPSHWEAQILDYPQPIGLTLSGHTHGMQFGIEVPGFKWSPSKYIYPQWAGLYSRGEKHIYVNRGFGYLGFPGRVGILPEITVLTLQPAP